MNPRFPNVDRKIDLAALNATAMPFDKDLKTERFGHFSICRDAYTGSASERVSVRNLPILTHGDPDMTGKCGGLALRLVFREADMRCGNGMPRAAQ